MRRHRHIIAASLFVYGALFPQLVFAVQSVAPGIPEAQHRNVIVQLFNWQFDDIKSIIPQLKELGYSHIHVSPPQQSNDHVGEWWGRYQPIDFSVINSSLGDEQEFQALNDEANQHNMQIVADVVFNHTVDVTELGDPSLIVLQNNKIVVSENFPQFEPDHFHHRCMVDDHQPGTVRTCWLSNNLADLKTESAHVRGVAKEYLQKLVTLGVDGFRFDAVKHIEPEFFTDVLSAVPGVYAFGEIIEGKVNHYFDSDALDYYDFPLLAAMRDAFTFGGDLRLLVDAPQHNRALAGPKAVTFVRNHDIDRGQANDRGLTGEAGLPFGVGWDGTSSRPDRTDVNLAYAFIFGREDGLPYVFVDMKNLPQNEQDDEFDDPVIAAGIRFHNLCLANPDGSGRRADIWRITTPNALGWQRGTDRFVVINKAGESYRITNLVTSLQKGTYKDVHTGWLMHVQADGKIIDWNVPPRTAVMFVSIGD